MGQVGRGMRKIGIHFKDIIVLPCNGPFESMDIGGPRSKFLLPDFPKKRARILFVLWRHALGRAARGNLVPEEDMKDILEANNGTAGITDVRIFTKGRD